MLLLMGHSCLAVEGDRSPPDMHWKLDGSYCKKLLQGRMIVQLAMSTFFRLLNLHANFLSFL